MRDDCSTDGTSDLLKTFAEACKPGQVVLVPSGSLRLGPFDNFFTLLAHAPIGARYAFCDQDDVWLPNKITRAVEALRCCNATKPALYCSRQVIVDKKLRRLRVSPDVFRLPSLNNALVQNIATGNTIVINDAARRAILAAPLPSGSFHDWWCYLVVTAVGGAIIFDRCPTILYRQHCLNVVGTAAGFWLRFARFMRRGYTPFMNLFSTHSRVLLTHPQLTEEANTLLRSLHALPEVDALRKIRRLYALNFYRQSYLENLALKLWFLLWCIRGK